MKYTYRIYRKVNNEFIATSFASKDKSMLQKIINGLKCSNYMKLSLGIDLGYDFLVLDNN